jgi:hypothetical protein
MVESIFMEARNKLFKESLKVLILLFIYLESTLISHQGFVEVVESLF